MCIALLTTAHPAYALILVDNRDEFLNRPTAPATWWPSSTSNTSILGGRDLLRHERGTWLGVTRSGRIAVLTNFREDVTPPPSAVSRGAIIKDFLSDNTGRSTGDYVRDKIREGTWGEVGGFSLVCGKMGEGLNVVSNRTVKAGDDSNVPEIMATRGETVGLSNAAFGDHGWKKVSDGEKLLVSAVRESTAQDENEEQLIDRLLALLSTDTLPRHNSEEGGLESYIGELRHTIFVPALGRKAVQTLPGDEIATGARKNEPAEVLNGSVKDTRPQLGASGMYGTQKQSVVLVDHAGKARFFERTLYDNDSDPVPVGHGDVDMTFQVEQ